MNHRYLIAQAKALSARPCETCGDAMWPRGSRRQCTPCAQGWYVEPPRSETVVEQTTRERQSMAIRLATIRADKSARQRRFMGIEA